MERWNNRINAGRPRLDTTPIADKGFPLPTTKEWGEGKGEGQPKERPSCGNEPLSPTLSPLVPRGEREHTLLLMVTVPRCAHAGVAVHHSRIPLISIFS